MSRTRRRTLRGVAAAGAAVALAASGLAVAPGASAATTGTDLQVAITDHGLYLNGPTTFPAGRVHLSVDAAGKNRCANIAQLATGYSFHDLRHDVQVAFANLGPGGDTKKGLKALNRFINHTTAYGGFYTPEGAVRHGTDLLSTPGSYVLLECTNLPRRPVPLTVTGPVGPQTLQSTSATVKAVTKRRFRGDTTLPSHGNITFKNKSTESPHFMSFQHVKDGTTRRQVIKSFSSNGPPDFLRRGHVDSDILSMGQSFVMRLHLPPGHYALACFFPDPKTGQPHAFMGMVRMVDLKS